MAHRMFNSKIIEKSNFLKMPLSSQALYFHLGMNADDDGIAEAYKVMRLIGANEDDLRVLAAREFIKVLNDDDVIFIMDWNHHNKIRTDRKVDSIYQSLLIQIVPNIDVRKSTKHLCQTNDGQMSDKCQQKTRQDKIIQDNTRQDKLRYVNSDYSDPFNENTPPPPPLSQISYDEDICKNNYELLHLVYQDIKKHNPKMPLVTGNMQPGDLSSLDANLAAIYKLCNYQKDEFINVMQLKINDGYWAGELAKCNYPLARVISRICKQVITDLQKKEITEKEKAIEQEKIQKRPLDSKEKVDLEMGLAYWDEYNFFRYKKERV